MIELWPLVSGGGFISSVVVLRAGELARARRSLVTYQLRFPRQLPAEQVEAFLTGWTGSLPPAWKRWATGVPFLIIEVVATPGRIEHRLLVPAAWTGLAESLLRAHLPNARFEVVPGGQPKVQIAAEYRLSNSQRPLAVNAVHLSAGLLTSLLPLRKGEVVAVQYTLAPAAPVRPVDVASQSSHGGLLMHGEELVETSEAAAALRKKYASSLLVGIGRIGITAGPGRRVTLLRHVEAGWHGVRAPGVLLRRRWLPLKLAASDLRHRRVPLLRWPSLLNASEATGLVGFPIEIEQLPGLDLGGCRLLPVADVIPTSGILLGIGTYPGTNRTVALDLPARVRHVHICGPTGSGKSVLLAHMAETAAADHGSSLIVIDAKDGTLVDAVLEQLPTHRLDDVLVLDPTDKRPLGLNPLASVPEQRELVVDRVISIMSSIWGSAFGPRSTDLVRHALLTITQSEGLTICEAAPLLVDQSFRRRVLDSIDDPVGVMPFWNWFNNLSPAEATAMTAAPLNKLRVFSRSVMRWTLGQSQPALDFEQVLNHHGVLLVRLPAGLLGEDTASLLGAMITSQLWQAISARAALPPDQRPPATILIDEVQTVLRLPTASIEEMLSQARSYNASLTLAHQNRHQLPSDLLHSVGANARSKVVFGCGREDAVAFARDLGGGLTPDDLMGLDAYEAVTAVFAAGRTQPPATIRTLPPPAPLRPAEELKARSRQRFGTDRAVIERDLQARLHGSASTATTPVGRRPRRQS